MGQQEELTKFFDQISNPLRIAVQRELFVTVLRDKNTMIKETMRVISEEAGNANENPNNGELQSQVANLPKKKIKQVLLVSLASERLDGFIPSIVERLDTSLQTPHNPVINQGEMDD